MAYIRVWAIDNETNDPISGVEVTVETLNGSRVDQGTTGSDGKYSLYLSSSGSYLVYLNKQGYDVENFQGMTQNTSNSYVSYYLQPIMQPGYMAVTRYDRQYTGSSQVLATCTSSSGYYYLGFGSSTTTAPTSWTHGDISKTAAGTYYIWGKCDAATRYYAKSAYYVGTATITAKSAGSIGTAITPSAQTYSGGSYTFSVASSGATNTVSIGAITSITKSGSSVSSSGWSYSSANHTVTTASGISAGTYSVTLAVSVAETDSYYAASGTCTWNLTVNKVGGSGTVTMSGYTYGGTKSTPNISTTLPIGTATYYYNTSNSASGGTAWSNVTSSTSLNAGTYYMYAVVSESTNVLGFTTGTTAFTISKASQSAPTATGNSSTYATSGSISGSASGGGGVGTLYYKSDSAGGTSYGTATTTAPSRSRSSVGTTTFVAYWSGNGNYNASGNSNQASLTVNKADQPMTISPTSKTIYNTSGYNTFTITPSNAQGSVSYSSSNTSVATVNTSGVVTYVGAGSCTITATAGGNGNYNSGSKTCTVNCVVDTVKSLSASTSTSSISYGGTATISVTATYESGYITDVTTSVSYTSSPTGIITIS